jgi:Tfp pilus assembly protein PilF
MARAGRLENSQADAVAVLLRESLQSARKIVNYHAMLAEALNRQGRTANADEEMRPEAGIRAHMTERPASISRISREWAANSNG